LRHPVENRCDVMSEEGGIRTMKKFLVFGATALVAVMILVGIVAYAYLKPVAAASEPIQAIAIADTAGTTTGNTTYTIGQEVSTASFVIDEVLNGEPVTVVGATNQVAGQLSVNPTSPSNAQVGTIQINARTFATDSANRDKAIQNRILETGSYEYITFTPTSFVRLPETAAIGQSYTFQIVGQLTIRDQTREATFNATVTPAADGTLQGNVTTTIKYADWGISVPSVPIVTGLAETVTLNLDFVANPN
jgi:polyisoprenoid-binding protein YceI